MAFAWVLKFCVHFRGAGGGGSLKPFADTPVFILMQRSSGRGAAITIIMWLLVCFFLC